MSENKKQRFSKKAANVKILPPSSSGRALLQVKDKKNTRRMIICQESTKSHSPVSNGPQVHHSENENVKNILQHLGKVGNEYLHKLHTGCFFYWSALKND